MPNNWELSGNAGWFDGAAKVGYKLYPSLKCVAKSCVFGTCFTCKKLCCDGKVVWKSVMIAEKVA